VTSSPGGSAATRAGSISLTGRLTAPGRCALS
jgi:hypothetical protein